MAEHRDAAVELLSQDSRRLVLACINATSTGDNAWANGASYGVNVSSIADALDGAGTVTITFDSSYKPYEVLFAEGHLVDVSADPDTVYPLCMVSYTESTGVLVLSATALDINDATAIATPTTGDILRVQLTYAVEPA